MTMKKNWFYHPLVKGICLVLCFGAILACAFCGLKCLYLDSIGVMRETPRFSITMSDRLQFTDSIHLYWPDQYEWEAMWLSEELYWYTQDTLYEGLQDVLRSKAWQAFLTGNGDMPQIVKESGADVSVTYPVGHADDFMKFLNMYSGGNSNFRFRIFFDDVVILSNDTAWKQELIHGAAYKGMIKNANGESVHSITLEFGLLKGLPHADDYRSYCTAWERDVQIWENWLAAAGITAVISVLFLVCLLAQSGKRYGEDGIRLNVIDRLPLEPVLFVQVMLGLFAMAGIAGMEWYIKPLCVLLFGYADGNLLDWMVPILIMVLFVALVVLALAVLCGLVRRIRAGKWWRNTIVYRILRPIGRGLRWLWSMGHTVIDNLPLAAKWLLGCAVFGVWTLLVIAVQGLVVVWFFTALAAGLLLCVYMLEFDAVKRTAKTIAAGDINAHADTARLHGTPKQIGDALNHIGDAISVAVEERMKSERFRTELITNVSHDLKTPLTSIINYTDLLTKEACENETMKEYIDVLSRQAIRLKKLTEDLLEVSKASSGTLTVSAALTDAAEILMQATGEYAERFAARGLQVITEMKEQPLWIMADGRHLWRVFDNLLGNICKYAMPGTRVYLTAERVGGNVVLSFRNISENPIAVTAEELSERFVRGDASRHTEGSGLGLAIADSLCRLQGGVLSLTVDGDLFKAVVTFEKVTAPTEADLGQVLS